MRAPAIVYCAWCKTITIPARITGCVVIFPEEGMRRAHINGVPSEIADGICQSCRAEKFGDVPRKVTTNDLATK